MDVFLWSPWSTEGKGGGGESGWEEEGEGEKEKEGGEGGGSTTILSKSPKAARKNHQCPMSLFPSLA